MGVARSRVLNEIGGAQDLERRVRTQLYLHSLTGVPVWTNPLRLYRDNRTNEPDPGCGVVVWPARPWSWTWTQVHAPVQLSKRACL